MVRVHLIALLICAMAVLAQAKPVAFGPERVVVSGVINDVAVGDVNGDGHPDLVVSENFGNTVTDDKVTWYENDGKAQPNFTAHPVTTFLSGPNHILLADLDGDGFQDLVVDEYRGFLNWLNPKMGAKSGLTDNQLLSRPLDVADLNADGKRDLIFAASGGTSWQENDGQNPPGFTEHAVTITSGSLTSCMAADLNGDGHADLAAIAMVFDEINYAIGWYGLWLESDGANPPHFSEHRLDGGSLEICVADLNDDAHPDLITLYDWYENDGLPSPTFSRYRIISSIGYTSHSVFPADVNGDEKLDLVMCYVDIHAQNVKPAVISWCENDGNQTPTFIPHEIARLDKVAKVLAADLDGEGSQDVIAATTDKVAWYPNLVNNNAARAWELYE